MRIDEKYRTIIDRGYITNNLRMITKFFKLTDNASASISASIAI